MTVDTMLKNEKGQLVAVTSVENEARTEIVYDLTVADNHNFYVSKAKVLVHNISPCEKLAQELAKAVPSACRGKYVCDDFVVYFEKKLLEKGYKGKRLCLKFTKSYYLGSVRHGNISENNQHFAVQVGELVFDNMYPDGMTMILMKVLVLKLLLRT